MGLNLPEVHLLPLGDLIKYDSVCVCVCVCVQYATMKDGSALGVTGYLLLFTNL